MVISQGALGTGKQFVINNFNLALASGSNPFSGSNNGFAGIFLPQALSLNASANAGIDPPAPNFIGGTSQSYPLAVDAPSTST